MSATERTKEELYLLNKFNLKDFRELRTSQVLELVSELKNYSPEIQKMIIEQMPQIFRMYVEIVKICKNELDAMMDRDDNETNELFSTYNGILLSLQQTLDESDGLTVDETLAITDQMIRVAELKTQIHNNNQIHRENMTDKFLYAAIGGITSMLGLFLSSIIFKKSPSKRPDGEDEDDDNED